MAHQEKSISKYQNRYAIVKLSTYRFMRQGAMVGKQSKYTGKVLNNGEIV